LLDIVPKALEGGHRRQHRGLDLWVDGRAVWRRSRKADAQFPRRARSAARLRLPSLSRRPLP
ncbi:hypothetical protein, partial [Mesorhizobium sp.]|uniref:hypothetical protein n=1 Tax=Mesorhizobium sp. TaxID=1871066 RepID=UPI0025D6DF02